MTKKDAVGLWRSSFAMEASASLKLAEMLNPFQKPVEICYECGVEVPTLKCKRSKEKDLRVSSLFLKRTLNDLRAIWHLLLLGYTSQAGSIAAAAFENALIASCVAGNVDRADRLLNSESGDSPWSVVELCKMKAKQMKEEAEIIEETFTEKDFDLAWMGIYGAYKWLCRIKHPTLPSTLHDAFSASAKSEEFVVMAAPDIREEDLPNKFTILAITISRIHDAIRSFAFSIKADHDDPRVILWTERLNTIIPSSMEAYESVRFSLPFDIKYSRLAKEYANLKQDIGDNFC